MSKERARNRDERRHEAAVKAAAKGHEQDRQERQVSMKGSAEVLGKHGGEAITQPQHHKVPKAARAGGAKPAQKQAQRPDQKAAQKQAPKQAQGKGRPTPKQSAARTPATKKRSTSVGRPDGPLARRRRNRVRLLVGLLLVVNVAAGIVWRDWAVSLAVLIGSIILAPLLAAMLLRRKR